MEVVANTGKRVDCLFRDAIQVGRRIAEALGHGSTHLEVELAMRILGDAAVHCLYLGLEFLRVETNGSSHDGPPCKEWCRHKRHPPTSSSVTRKTDRFRARWRSVLSAQGSGR